MARIKHHIALALAVGAAAAFTAIPAGAAKPTKPTRGAKPVAACANADLIPAGDTLAAIRRATLCLLNAERRQRGLRALKSNSRLRSAADRYAREMVAKNFFGHVSPAGSTMLQRIKKTAYLRDVRAYSVGENLAWGTGGLSTPAQTVQNWMESPPHRRNVLDRSFREIGIGVALGAPHSGDPGATYTTEFGRRS